MADIVDRTITVGAPLDFVLALGDLSCVRRVWGHVIDSCVGACD